MANCCDKRFEEERGREERECVWMCVDMWLEQNDLFVCDSVDHKVDSCPAISCQGSCLALALICSR